MTVLGRSAGLPKAIILDLDDTILDSGDPEVSWRRVSAEFAAGFEGVVPGRLFDVLIEARNWFWDSDEQAREGRLDLVAARRTIFARALSNLGAPRPDVATLDAMARRYTALRDEAVTPFPWALEALRRLRSSGSKLALLTKRKFAKAMGQDSPVRVDNVLRPHPGGGRCRRRQAGPRGLSKGAGRARRRSGGGMDGWRQPARGHSWRATGRHLRNLD